MPSLTSNKGQALISVLVAATVAAIVLHTFFKQISTQQKAERGLASKLDLDEMSRMVMMILNNDDVCATSGLVGVDISPLVNSDGSPRPSPTPVAISLSLGNNQMMAGMEFNSTRKVSSLNLSAVSRAGLGKYVGTVELATEVMGNATISKWKTKRFTVLISADASRRTTACGMVSSGSSSKANEAPQGTAWARDLADTNPGVLPMGSFMDSYAVPRGKTLIVHNVEPIANNGFVDCQLGDGLDVYSVSHAREDRGTSRFIAMTNPVVFSENTRVAYGAKAGNGGRGATSFSCSFLGVLVDNDRFDSPGNFKGFNAIHIRSGIRPATMRYTVPQGKKFTLLNNIGSSLDNDDVRCSMHFGGSNTFHFKFATMPGSTTRAIPRPITFEAGTAITFEVDIRGAGLVDIGHCSWVGYESDED